MNGWRPVAAVVCLLAACGRTEPLSEQPRQAPRLPAPSGAVVHVASAAELQRAIRGLEAHTTILLSAGRYVLDDPLRIGSPAGAPLTEIAIRGASGNPADVVIEGRGLEIGRAEGVQVADLSFAGTDGVSLLVDGRKGAARVHVYNARFADATGQMLRAIGGSRAAGSPGGIIEFSLFEYTAADRGRRSAGAIAISGGSDWIVRYNVFRNIASGADASRRLRPALVARDGSAGTQTHNNLFVDCDRAIVYGMGAPGSGKDHAGGAIYNNFVYRRRGARGDAGIMLWGAAGTFVHHNTVIQNGTYQRPIEYRFASSTGIDVRNNLTDGAIEGRDGAQAVLAGNYTKATTAMFRRARSGDLRLNPSAVAAIDKGVQTSVAGVDWDGDVRPSGGRPDIGADEYQYP